MKTKILALLLALSLLTSLSACGKKESPDTAEEVETVEPVQPEEVPEATPEKGPEEEAPAEEEETPTETPENAGGQDSASQPAQKPAEQPVEKPAQKPAETPAQKPAEKPAEPPAGSQSKPAPSVDLAAFYESLTANNANMPAMMQAEGETLDAFYPGLGDIKANQCGVYMAMISAVVGEIALVEVENAADVQAVKDIFQARIDYQVGDDTNPGGAWYPDTIEGWKNNSRIVSNGNYVMLVALEGADDVVAAFNALFA